MKKKFILLLLAGMLLTGCSQNTQSSSEANNTDANVTELSDETVEKKGEETTDETVVENEAESETQSASENTDAQSENTDSQEEAYILNFEASTIEGETLTSETFAGSKLTMINVWATYCNPCLSEMPDLGEIAAAYDTADFQIIGIISDVAEGAEEDDVTNAKDLITQTGANYPHLLLNESLYTNLVGAVDSVPTTFFVNQEGEILGYTIGAKSKADWEEIINGLLEENK